MVYLGMEPVPLGVLLQVKTKKGNVDRVKIARVLQDPEGHWFGDWRKK